VYDFVEGEIAFRSATRLVLHAGGIGFDLAVPLGTERALDGKTRARLFVHLVSGESEWKLFGFVAPDERNLFRKLLSVNGVGPSIALSLLSTLRPEGLARAFSEEDEAALRRVRGVGEKTARRLLLELRGKIPLPETGRVRVGADLREDAVAALRSLGFARAEAEAAVEAALRAAPTADLESLVRAALGGNAAALSRS
jgi:Holliday junction DNA helicase RuvA